MENEPNIRAVTGGTRSRLICSRTTPPPYAEPLLGVVLLEPFHLNEAQLGRDAHRSLIGDLGSEDDRLTRKRVSEPVKRGRARLGCVPEPPLPREEQIAKLGLSSVAAHVTAPTLVAPVKRDKADHLSHEVNDEQAGTAGWYAG